MPQRPKQEHAPSVEEDLGALATEPRKKGWVWLVYLALFAIAIPWYWPAGYRGPLVAGIPLWAATSIASVSMMAIWTVWIIHRYWQFDGGP